MTDGSNNEQGSNEQGRAYREDDPTNPLGLSLPELERDKLGAAGGTPFEPMPGRRMREYMVLPPAFAADAELMRAWLARAFRHTAKLPAKPVRAAARRRA